MGLFLVIYRVVWSVESNEYGFGGAITNHRNSETNRNHLTKSGYFWPPSIYLRNPNCFLELF